MSTIITEGKAEFKVPAAGKPCWTWYKVVGNLKSRRPLVVLHGGPGSTHNYMLTLADLATKYSIPVVLYDQLGNGLSTHLPEKNGDITFWTEELFRDELDNLLAHLGIGNDYDLLGQSWGGMLAAAYASKQPQGLHKLVVASAPADMVQWVVAADILRKDMPLDIQEALSKHEANGTYDDPEYKKAVDVYYEKHLCTVKPMPEEFLASMKHMEEDSTVVMTMNGPSEFTITGSLKTWSVIKDIPKINVPTLLTNGRHDEAQDSTMQPFFDGIQKVKWVQFANSSHTSHLEERERYMEVVSKFLLAD
ncbi:Alpha/Beta hydrolase protein, partial [Mycena floridula]